MAREFDRSDGSKVQNERRSQKGVMQYWPAFLFLFGVAGAFARIEYAYSDIQKDVNSNTNKIEQFNQLKTEIQLVQKDMTYLTKEISKISADQKSMVDTLDEIKYSIIKNGHQ